MFPGGGLYFWWQLGAVERLRASFLQEGNLRDAAARTYVPLDAATYAAIVAGTRPLG